VKLQSQLATKSEDISTYLDIYTASYSASQSETHGVFALTITHSHGSVRVCESVVRTTVKVNGEWQNLTLSRW